MPILYSAVFRGVINVADYSTIPGNFNAVAKEYLTKASRNDGKYTYVVEGTTFNFFTKDGTTFLCVADEGYGRILPAAYLDKLAADWAAEVGDKLPRDGVQEGQLTATYSKRIKKLVDQITASPEQFSKIQAVQQKVNVAKDVMLKNMETMMIRQEKLDTMVDKSDGLLDAANQFQSSGKKLRSHMWWNNIKMKIIIAAAVLLLILILFLVICFSAVHCFSSSSSPSLTPNPSPSLVLSPSPSG